MPNNQIAARATSASARPALLSAKGAALPSVVLLNRNQRVGDQLATEYNPVNLEAVRDYVAKQTALQAPRDLTRSPEQLSIRWDPEYPYATLHGLGGFPGWVGEDVAPNEGIVFTASGLKAYLREICPAYGANFLDALVAKDAAGGAKLATLNCALLARGNDRPLQLRTVRTKLPTSGRIVRAVRGVFRDYTPFDDIDFLNSLLDNPETRRLPVLSVHRTTDGMRIRFALAPADSIGPHNPVPMVEGWNSETGHRSTGITGGAWKLVCTNGMSVWSREGGLYSWRHTGRASRVRDGLPQALGEIRNRAEGVVSRYEQAIDVAIDDAARWLDAQLADFGVGAATTEAVLAALDHEVVTPRRMLASTVDAVTWVAQQEIDSYRQHDLEGIAVGLMDAGLAEAAKAPDRVLRAPVAEA